MHTLTVFFSPSPLLLFPLLLLHLLYPSQDNLLCLLTHFPPIVGFWFVSAFPFITICINSSFTTVLFPAPLLQNSPSALTLSLENSLRLFLTFLLSLKCLKKSAHFLLLAGRLRWFLGQAGNQELLGGDGGSATESPPGPLSPPGFKIGAVLVCLPHMDIVKA